MRGLTRSDAGTLRTCLGTCRDFGTESPGVFAGASAIVHCSRVMALLLLTFPSSHAKLCAVIELEINLVHELSNKEYAGLDVRRSGRGEEGALNRRAVHVNSYHLARVSRTLVGQTRIFDISFRPLRRYNNFPFARLGV